MEGEKNLGGLEILESDDWHFIPKFGGVPFVGSFSFSLSLIFFSLSHQTATYLLQKKKKHKSEGVPNSDRFID